ncbi:MAG: radical SAM protein [Polyangiaceae bacterium]
MTHRRVPIVPERWFPAYVVWELTLRCNHACHHCGSRAGVAREDELDTDEAVRVARELAELGAREVVLLGGEAYLHPGFLQVLSALRDHGVARQLTTGGRDVTPELAREMANAGLQSASVSVDGLEATHDRLRNARGSQREALSALRALRDAGVKVGSTINLNRANRFELEPLYELLKGAGISAWQIQLTAPLGRAADRTDLMLQPHDLLISYRASRSSKSARTTKASCSCPATTSATSDRRRRCCAPTSAAVAITSRAVRRVAWCSASSLTVTSKVALRCRAQPTWAATCASARWPRSGMALPRSPSRATAAWTILGFLSEL